MFLNNNKKFIIIIIYTIIFLYHTFSENWVGKAATLQITEGTPLADGTIFNNDQLIAACNGFKIGAEVNVINPKNGKSITVIIKERINADKDYFILLSPKSSSSLDLEWDTNLVIVEGKFADVNSTERLVINGLVKEGEIDPETLKKFPEINWPNNENVTKEKSNNEYKGENTPLIDKNEIPSQKKQAAKLDTDESNGYKIESEKQYEELPEQEKNLTPEIKMKKFILSEDFDSLGSKNETATNIKEPKKNIIWDKELKSGNIYIRISTAFNKNEGDRRYMLFSMIFPNVIGILENNKYIIFVGPVEKEAIDVSLKKIKNYGFKDAYIVKK